MYVNRLYVMLIVILCVFVGAGCRPSSQDNHSDAWKQYQKQQADYEADKAKQKEDYALQIQEYQKLMEANAKRTELAWAIAEKQQQKDAELQARFEKLLVKWEKQAARYDHILGAMEKKFNVTQKE